MHLSRTLYLAIQHAALTAFGCDYISDNEYSNIGTFHVIFSTTLFITSCKIWCIDVFRSFSTVCMHSMCLTFSTSYTQEQRAIHQTAVKSSYMAMFMCTYTMLYVGAKWSNMYDGTYSLGTCMSMLFFDFWLYGFLAWYFNKVHVHFCIICHTTLVCMYRCYHHCLMYEQLTAVLLCV